MAKRDRTREGSGPMESTPEDANGILEMSSPQDVKGDDLVKGAEQARLAKQANALAGIPDADDGARNRELRDLNSELQDINLEHEADLLARTDTTTGEIPDDKPAGGDTPADETPELEVVSLATKLVAKDIVGRSALKCTKKFTHHKGSDGKPLYDADGNPIGEWEVSPPRDLYIIFGTANGTRTGTTNYGDWNSFTGQFEAQRYLDGQRFAATEVILQEPANTLLLRELVTVKRRDRSASIVFSFIVGVKTSQRWVDTGEGSSYAFTLKSVFRIQKHDPLAAMRKALAANLPKMLAAPPASSTAVTPES